MYTVDCLQLVDGVEAAGCRGHHTHNHHSTNPSNLNTHTHTHTGLGDCHGAAFEELYTRYEREGRFRRQVRAQDLWFAILDSQIETGTPYMLVGGGGWSGVGRGGLFMSMFN